MNRNVFPIMWVGCLAVAFLAAWPAAGQETMEAADVPAPAVLTPPSPAETPAPAAAETTASLDALALEEEQPVAVEGTAVSQAEEFVRRGVALYSRELYSEALSEFNRALALEPDNARAREYIQMCGAKLQLATAGITPADPSSIPALDPESISQAEETPRPTAEEIKRDRVRQLMDWGRQYLEAQKYTTAAEIYQEVMLIEPTNEEAKLGLHQATIGVSKQSIAEREREVEEFRQRMREFIEDSKMPPEGADARGIKPYTLRVPVIEEKIEEVVEKTELDKALESPVNIEFDNIHISEIMEFVSDTWDINIVIDNRVVAPPRRAAPTPTGAVPGAGVPGAPGAPGAAPYGGAPAPYGGAPAAYPGAAPTYPTYPTYPTTPARPGATPTGAESQAGYQGFRTDGMVPYINLNNVSLAEALRALLRPLGLDYSKQKSFLWISTPSIIRTETFEPLETRFYELRNAGTQTLFKIVLRNRFGVSGGGGYGGYGGGMGGYGGGGYGGGGYGGGGYGGYGGGGYGGGGYGGGGYGGGGYGGGGYGGGGYGGGGYGGMGGYGGGGYGGGGYGGGGYGGGGYGGMGGYGGGMGGYGGGMGGYGGGMGGYGGGMGGYGGGGRSDVTQLSNISDLFSTINDLQVGEPQANPGIVGLTDSGTGATSTTGAPGGAYGSTTGATLGSTTSSATTFDNESPVIALLSRLVDEVYEPFTNERLSEMIYNPATNMLIVKNTPTNLDKLERYIAEIDVTPRQVSIEAKFLTVRVSDLDKVGFTWDLSLSDQNARAQKVPGLEEQGATYDYDINGDGVDESIPFYSRPDGSNVISNTITEGLLSGVVNPAPSQSTFNFVGSILDNEDGDNLSVTFDFLDRLEESELLSAPRVTTMNLKPAVIADFTTEYFVYAVNSQVYTTDAGFGGTPTTAFTQNVVPQPYNFGISLSVTPQIGDNDQVRLWLNPEVRTRTGEKSFTTTNIVGENEFDNKIVVPTTSMQAVWTNVIVHDGDTLVLGGLVSDQSARGEDKLPYLADIPLLGYFFRGKGKTVQQQSLLIFVTPDIIDPTGAKFFEAPPAS